MIHNSSVNNYNLLIAICLQFGAFIKHIVVNQNVALFAALRDKKIYRSINTSRNGLSKKTLVLATHRFVKKNQIETSKRKRESKQAIM